MPSAGKAKLIGAVCKIVLTPGFPSLDSFICFFFIVPTRPTVRPFLNRWSALMQVLFESRDAQAQAQAHDLRDVAQRGMRSVFDCIDGLIPKALPGAGQVDRAGGLGAARPIRWREPGATAGFPRRGLPARPNCECGPADVVVERHFQDSKP